jgi:tetratricopeptide (TPR) repeat protein
MKTKTMRVVMTAILFALAARGAWGQTVQLEGKVRDGNKPLADVWVLLTAQDNNKASKIKTDKSGNFVTIGLAHGVYTVEVIDAAGNAICREQNRQIGGGGGEPVKMDLDVSGPCKVKGATKEEIERIKAENTKAASINVLIKQYNDLQQAGNWKEAEPVLKQMVAAEPNNWRFYQALGAAQFNLDEFEDAVGSYGQGIQLAQGALSSGTTKDPSKPENDPAKIKTGIGQMLASQGNAYLKLKKNDEAVAAFTKAAEMDPNPSVAYFNLCATQYNTGNTQGALAACDKAIAADPNKADAYFIKGSLMMADSKQDKDGKIVAPAGTAEALNKYLELAPDGAHANDVKQMLQFIGSKVETTYGKKKK